MKENSFNQINLGQSDVGITKKTKSSKSESERTIEQTYQKMSQLEHILLRPDTYGNNLSLNRISYNSFL